MICLMIKGTAFEASRAVTERGIVAYARPSKQVAENQCIIVVPEECWATYQFRYGIWPALPIEQLQTVLVLQ